MKILARAWYRATLAEFRRVDVDSILGALVQRAAVATAAEEVAAWRREIAILRDCLPGTDGEILLEYSIPRVGGRADAVLVLSRAIVVVEFKIGADAFSSAAREQVWDYALDLKNFHQASRDVPIIPVIVATEAPDTMDEFQRDADGVHRPVRASTSRLAEVLRRVIVQASPARAVAVAEWAQAPYRPTPTIIEAARALYAREGLGLPVL